MGISFRIIFYINLNMSSNMEKFELAKKKGDRNGHISSLFFWLKTATF